MSFSSNTEVLVLGFLCLLFTMAQPHNPKCSDDFNKLITERNIANCTKFTALDAEFGWAYHNDSRVEILIGAPVESKTGWLAWGVNPSKRAQMVGTRALIGIKQPNNSLTLNTYNVTKYTKLGCQLLPSNLDVQVIDKKMGFLSQNNFLYIYAVMNLTGYNNSALNIVWQVGFHSDGEEPKMHHKYLQNFDSRETINLKNEKISALGESRDHLRTVHGILNIAGYGVFFPIGVVVARYFRRFPFKKPWWKEAHKYCQLIGFLLGSTGWAIGLWLGNASKGYIFRTHRILGIFIFTFTTVQMLAWRLRPSPTDEYRKYWNMYHHFLGYALISLTIINIFEGISNLKPDNMHWKWGYIGILIALAGIGTGFELYTWFAFFKLKKKEKKKNGSTDAGETKHQY
ncbi:AIR12, DOMON domain [Dillenia turbinata]|uniref:Cytochrome b561 and DOMON domain-containing protein n=1 Tax=Dillenia turbinata TaxID=194707 RepID=A0AAN8ZE66_9MAGN